MLRIVLDPGHGGTDPGAVWRGLYEKNAALDTALTLKSILKDMGHEVTLTRVNDSRPEYAERTERRNADLFISVHYNSPAAKPLLYYASDGPHQLARSQAFAEHIAQHLKIPAVPSTQSRFGRLYIDDVTYGPALLWEVAGIDDYRNAARWRIVRCEPFAAALVESWRAVFERNRR